MEFMVEKDEGTIPFVLSQILDTCVNGITLSDPDREDNPLVYVNEAFEFITGYGQEEVIGRNCRFLQNEDHDQEGIELIRQAIRDGKSATTTLRNYRKDGTLFYNQFTIRPLFDRRGKLIYYLGIQHDVTNQVEAEAELKQLNALIKEADGDR